LILAFIDIIPATIKTFFFGFFIGMIDVIKDSMLKMEQQVWVKLQIQPL
jgi:hypothetical protein